MKREKKKTKDILIKGTGRFGIIEKKSYLIDSTFILEIEEVEEAGGLTKVRIVELVLPEGCSRTKHELLKKLKT